MSMSEYFINKAARADERAAIQAQQEVTVRALRELLELVEISEMECRSLPPHEYEAIKDGAISAARRALLMP